MPGDFPLLGSSSEFSGISNNFATESPRISGPHADLASDFPEFSDHVPVRPAPVLSLLPAAGGARRRSARALYLFLVHASMSGQAPARRAAPSSPIPEGPIPHEH